MLILPAGFPDPKVGAFDAMGLDGAVCADRYSRYGIYGYGQDHDNVEGFQKPSPIDWDEVNWAELQAKCFTRNADRFKVGRDNLESTLPLRPPSTIRDETRDVKGSSEGGFHGSLQQHRARSALLFRLWHRMEWTPTLQHYLRSLIMELGLHSGGEYEIFVLIDVKDGTPIHDDEEAVRQIKMSIPAEFRNMSILFDAQVLEEWYPDVEEHEYVLFPPKSG